MTGHRGLVQAVHSVIQAVHTRYADDTYPSCGRYISAMQMIHIRHAGDTYPPCRWYISVMQMGSVHQSSLP